MKLDALLSFAVVNPILSKFEERFEFVDDLSALLKYTVHAVAKQQFDLTFYGLPHPV